MSISIGRPLSEFGRRHYDEGEAHGKALAVLNVLEARGVHVPEAARVRIAGCTDTDQVAPGRDRDLC
jgi:hypothetical protein